MVDRYKPDVSNVQITAHMVAIPSGQYVKASDYDALAARCADIEAAAKAVIDRWDTPLWKDVPATAVYINRLRAAITPTRKALDELHQMDQELSGTPGEKL